MRSTVSTIAVVAFMVFAAGTNQAKAADGNPKLASVEAVFETTTNDKDHDSIVSIAVKKGNTVIASSSNTDGHWNDHTTHSVTLDTGGGWGRNDLGGQVKSELSFATNGNDKWEFNYILRLSWDDGTVTECRNNGQVLTQDDRFRNYSCSF